MLLEIPVIKQNISDFQVIRDHAETVLEEAKKVKKTGSQLMASHRWLERLGKTFARYQEESKKRAESLEQKRKMLEDVRKDLIWKIDSHRYYTQLLELEEGEKACRESEKEKNRMSEQLREAESHLASMQALKDFNEAEEAEQNLYKYSRELELLERKTPDSHRKLEKLKRHLRFSWKQEREKREGHKFKIEQENGELVSRRKHIEENLNESEQRRKFDEGIGESGGVASPVQGERSRNQAGVGRRCGPFSPKGLGWGRGFPQRKPRRETTAGAEAGIDGRKEGAIGAEKYSVVDQENGNHFGKEKPGSAAVHLFPAGRGAEKRMESYHRPPSQSGSFC